MSLRAGATPSSHFTPWPRAERFTSRGCSASLDQRLRESTTTMLASQTRRLLFLAASCLASAAAFAQLRATAEVAIEPPPWQPPALVVQGAQQPVRLQSLKVDVEVAGGVAETRVQMEFFNPNGRVLEGKLQFPLAAGQVVSGFALDVDGQLRDAVPVEKARGEQVFEDITRRRVDPGLLQTTIGNNYELRIYPLLPGTTRTVELRIVEPAAGRLQVPLAYADRVESLALSLRVPAAPSAPELIGATALGLRFEPASGGGFIARSTQRD